MEILRRAASPAPTAIAIGSFDGVHRGHQAMLARVGQAAGERGISAAALTFEPLPREYFAPLAAPARLSSLAEKLAAIAASDIGIAFVERFGERFAALTAGEFESRLARHHRARWVMVGQDFRYGAGRKGDSASLAAAGRALGFEVEVLPAVTIEGARVSSTRVREALASADFAAAARMLARPKAALQGIFAVKCFGAATRGLEGVASLGINPAVGSDGPATLEAFLFDFSGDLYGRRLTIEFVKKLRDEAHFASLDELRAQIERDCEAAREVFRAPRTW
ncbi:MAG TPA: bifunctional riboflavin kinase/FMN adenylyltransferase [Usitatibacter sp.]